MCLGFDIACSENLDSPICKPQFMACGNGVACGEQRSANSEGILSGWSRPCCRNFLLLWSLPSPATWKRSSWASWRRQRSMTPLSWRQPWRSVTSLSCRQICLATRNILVLCVVGGGGGGGSPLSFHHVKIQMSSAPRVKLSSSSSPKFHSPCPAHKDAWSEGPIHLSHAGRGRLGVMGMGVPPIGWFGKEGLDAQEGIEGVWASGIALLGPGNCTWCNRK